MAKAKKSADPSVLFDAEDDFGEDDFGDFEEPEAAIKISSTMPRASTGVSHSRIERSASAYHGAFR